MTKEEKRNDDNQFNIFGSYVQSRPEEFQNRPIKKIYINFDKDISQSMFGYRTRFDADGMKKYMGEGVPSVFASQQHKPIHFWVKEKMADVTDRYTSIEGYCLKQTVAKLLDSDKSEDELEIDKNRKLIKTNGRVGPNAGNTNPKVKRRWKNLPWYFDRVDEYEEQYGAVNAKQY